MHTAPLIIARIYRGAQQTGEVGYHGYATQRFGSIRHMQVCHWDGSPCHHFN